MFVDLVKNRISRSSNGFYCFLCKVDIVSKNETFLHMGGNTKHLEELRGCTTLKNLKVDEKESVKLINNGIVAINSRDFRCIFCCCNIPVGSNLKHVLEHLGGKKHITKRKKSITDSAQDLVYLEISNAHDNIYKEICDNLPGKNSYQDSSINNVEENISHSEQSKQEIFKFDNFSFFCNKCQDTFKSNRALQYHNMFHVKHQLSDIVSFSFKENIKQILCLVCNFVVENEDELQNHLTEDVHVKRLIILQCPSNDTIMKIMYLNHALYPNIVIPSATNNNYNTLNEEFYRYFYYLQNIYQATAQKNQVSKGFNCNSLDISQQLEVPQINNLTLTSYFCFICNVKFIDENLLFMHCNYDYIHKFRMESIIFIFKDKYIKFVSFDNNEIIRCTKCHIEFTELNSAVIHLFDMCHLCDKSVKCISIEPNGKMLVNDKNLYNCSICNINVPTDAILFQHLTSNYHIIKMQMYYSNVNSGSFEKVIFHCPDCNMNFFNDKMLLEHFSLQHRNGLKNGSPMNNLIYPSTKNIYMLPDNPQLVSATNNPNIMQYYPEKKAYFMPSSKSYLQNNVFKSEINDQPKTIVPMNNCHKKKNYVTNCTLTRKENLINFSPRYVQLCIERGDANIFTVNVEKMKYLELGISLTFPYKLNRCCIPCGCEVPSDLQLLYEHLCTEEHNTNLQDMIHYDKYFVNYQEQLSDLELAKAYMHEDSDAWVKCYVCDINIKNCEINLKNHINSFSHCQNHQSYKKSADKLIKLFYSIFENLWYYIERFSCHLCCATFDFEIDYAKHLEDIAHLKEVEKRLIRNESLQFDCCVLCSSYWYSKSDYHKKHCSKESHKYILETRDFTVPDMSNEVKQLLINVEETIDRLVENSNQSSLLGRDIENHILKSVEEVVNFKYPQAKAYLFGSRISSLSFLDTDLDIYLECNNESKSEEDDEEILTMVRDCFFRHDDVWKILEVVLQTRVPLIKLRHKSSNLQCHISFFNSLSVEKSKILSYFVNAYLPCRKMILFLKKWSALCQLYKSGRKGINNFALSWYVIFYLQVKGIFPSVLQLIEQKNKSHLVTGWETGVSEKISVKVTNTSLVKLLHGFFTYYSEFNYISDVACPFLGKVIKKSNFSDINKLPNEMSFYKTQVKKEKVEFFQLDSPMCIQEPIDLSQNITKSVSKLQLRMLKQYCSDSAVILLSQI